MGSAHPAKLVIKHEMEWDTCARVIVGFFCGLIMVLVIGLEMVYEERVQEFNSLKYKQISGQLSESDQPTSEKVNPVNVYIVVSIFILVIIASIYISTAIYAKAQRKRLEDTAWGKSKSFIQQTLISEMLANHYFESCKAEFVEAQNRKSVNSRRSLHSRRNSMQVPGMNAGRKSARNSSTVAMARN